MNWETDESVAYVPAGFHSPVCLLSQSVSFLASLSLSLSYSLSLWTLCLPVCLWRRKRLHPVESGTRAQLQRLTSSLSARRFSPPAICTLSLSFSLALSLSRSLLSALNKPLTCCINYSSISLLSLPSSSYCVLYLHLHIPSSSMSKGH